MATTNKKTTVADNATSNALNNSVYSVDEFAGMHKSFNTTPDVVKAAFRVAGKTEATYAMAQKIIKKFKDEEV